MTMTKKEIMTKAWEIKHQDMRNDFGLCLRMAWEMARRIGIRQQAIINANIIAKASEARWSGYRYEVKVSDWSKGSQNRTYISMVETRTGTKHYAKQDYGYIDNNTDTYYPSKTGDLSTTEYDYTGRKIA